MNHIEKIEDKIEVDIMKFEEAMNVINDWLLGKYEILYTSDTQISLDSEENLR